MKLSRYRRSRISQHVGVLHAHKGGASVLRGESSWRTVSGVFLNTDRTGMVMFEFRRVCFPGPVK